MWDNPRVIRQHLTLKGFMANYTCWIMHGNKDIGENHIVTDDPVVDRVHHRVAQVETYVERAVESDIDAVMGDIDDGVDDDDSVNLDEILRHVQAQPRGFENLGAFLKAKEELLYEKSMGCHKRFTVLRSVLELMKLKASNAWSSKSFMELLLFSLCTRKGMKILIDVQCAMRAGTSAMMIVKMKMIPPT